MMQRVRSSVQMWELQMRRRFLTATQIKNELGLSLARDLEPLRTSGQLGYVMLGIEDYGQAGKRGIRRMLRYAPRCEMHASYRWCEHNGGCTCPGLDEPHAPHA